MNNYKQYKFNTIPDPHPLSEINIFNNILKEEDLYIKLIAYKFDTESFKKKRKRKRKRKLSKKKWKNEKKPPKWCLKKKINKFWIRIRVYHKNKYLESFNMRKKMNYQIFIYKIIDISNKYNIKSIYIVWDGIQILMEIWDFFNIIFNLENIIEISI